MKKIMAGLLAIAFLQTAAAQNTFGLGVMLGAPTGISVKFVPAPSRSIDLLFAWRIDDSFFAQGQYNYTITTLTKFNDSEIRLYGGPGIFLRTPPERHAVFGFSGDFGICLALKNNVEFFTEISPKIGLVEETEFDMTGGLGFRYLF